MSFSAVDTSSSSLRRFANAYHSSHLIPLNEIPDIISRSRSFDSHWDESNSSSICTIEENSEVASPSAMAKATILASSSAFFKVDNKRQQLQLQLQLREKGIDGGAESPQSVVILSESSSAFKTISEDIPSRTESKNNSSYSIWLENRVSRLEAQKKLLKAEKKHFLLDVSERERVELTLVRENEALGARCERLQAERANLRRVVFAAAGVAAVAVVSSAVAYTITITRQRPNNFRP